MNEFNKVAPTFAESLRGGAHVADELSKSFGNLKAKVDELTKSVGGLLGKGAPMGFAPVPFDAFGGGMFPP